MNATSSLTDRIQGLLNERQQHADAITAIEATLEQVNALLGAAPVSAGKPATKPTVAAPLVHVSAKGRRRFAITGEELIVAFIKARKNPTTREINAHWKQEGRGGTADTLLGEMVKAKKLKKKPLGQRLGSEYSLASAPRDSAVMPTAVPKKRGRPSGYNLTAKEFVLDFVKLKGDPTSQEIERYWQSEGRAGRAAKAISTLTQEKKLKRTPIIGGQGSRYSILR